MGNHAQSGWEAGNAEEDTLTGHLGGQLQTRRTRNILVNGHQWRWRVRYTKFRGRGRNAFEKRSGADGIVELEVVRTAEQIALYKGMLFQAKKIVGNRDARLIEQVGKMEQIAVGSSAVFEYGPNGYFAGDGRLYLRDQDPAALREQRLPLGSFLGDRFLPCESGLRGMYYDGVRGELLVPTPEGGVRAVLVELRNRIMIQVEGS